MRECDCCCGFYCDCYSSTYCSTCTNCSTYCTTTTSVYNSVPRHRRELHAGESHQIKSLGNMNKYSMYVQYILAQPASMTSMQVDCNPLYTGTPSSSSAKTTRRHHTSTVRIRYSLHHRTRFVSHVYVPEQSPQTPPHLWMSLAALARRAHTIPPLSTLRAPLGLSIVFGVAAKSSSNSPTVLWLMTPNESCIMLPR